MELATRQGMAGQAVVASADQPADEANDITAMEIPDDQVKKYQKLLGHLSVLQKKNDGFEEQGYSEDNVLVKDVTEQIKKDTVLQKKLEEQYPGLKSLGRPSLVSGSSQTSGMSSADRQTASWALIESKVTVLRALVERLKLQAAGLGEAEPKILDLQRKQKFQEQNMEFFIKSLDDARIHEALGAGKISNIKPIQQPTPPGPAPSKRQKIAGGLLVGGLFGGLALAFLIELFLDRSVKRPTEIETKLKLPLFLSHSEHALERQPGQVLQATPGLPVPPAAGTGNGGGE